MYVWELKQLLAKMPDELDVLVGCLDINGKPKKTPAWSVNSIAKTKKTCVIEIFYVKQ
ncbi:hypothetical protein LCGC14_2380540 [marine sediment metagenome]|uniref:Uncharacterized protein n=1 Tax=marine sediment metagenome TaxID=412755 RepID=A0A0F9EDH5_9ZZZZ